MGCLIHGERCTCHERTEDSSCPPEPHTCQVTEPAAVIPPIQLSGDSGWRFYEDLELGALVRRELSQGGCWHRLDNTGIDMSFSLSLLELADNSIRRLLSEWRPEVGSVLWKKWNEGR